MSSRVAVKRPHNTRPFFNIAGRWYVDLLFDFGQPLDIEFSDVMRFLVEVPSESIVLGRRLTSKEQRHVLRDMADADADIYGRLITDDRARWAKPK